MKLSDVDLRQMDEQWVESLAEEELRPTILYLLIIAKEQYDRINMTSQNSSRPSTGMAPRERSNEPESKPPQQPEPDSSKIR